jgi:hypothetical protein
MTCMPLLSRRNWTKKEQRLDGELVIGESSGIRPDDDGFYLFLVDSAVFKNQTVLTVTDVTVSVSWRQFAKA